MSPITLGIVLAAIICTFIVVFIRLSLHADDIAALEEDVENITGDINPGYALKANDLTSNATHIADETARSEIEMLANEWPTFIAVDHTVGHAYDMEILADPSGNVGNDQRSLDRIQRAVEYLELRQQSNSMSPLPFTMHRVDSTIWFGSPGAAQVDSVDPFRKAFVDEQTAQEVPAQFRVLEIERQAVKNLYAMGHRWTGREWVAPERMKPQNTVWSCKIGIGGRGLELPHGADAPMRDAVRNAFKDLTGKDDQFCFSGWGDDLDPIEKKVAFPPKA